MSQSIENHIISLHDVLTTKPFDVIRFKGEQSWLENMVIVDGSEVLPNHILGQIKAPVFFLRPKDVAGKTPADMNSFGYKFAVMILYMDYNSWVGVCGEVLGRDIRKGYVSLASNMDDNCWKCSDSEALAHYLLKGEWAPENNMSLGF